MFTQSEIRGALKELFKGFDGETNRINVYPDPGCLLCTAGTTPNRLNTGTCAFHRLAKFANVSL